MSPLPGPPWWGSTPTAPSRWAVPQRRTWSRTGPSPWRPGTTGTPAGRASLPRGTAPTGRGARAAALCPPPWKTAPAAACAGTSVPWGPLGRTVFPLTAAGASPVSGASNAVRSRRRAALPQSTRDLPRPSPAPGRAPGEPVFSAPVKTRHVKKGRHWDACLCSVFGGSQRT